MPPAKRTARAHGWGPVVVTTPAPADKDDGTATPSHLQGCDSSKEGDSPSLEEAATAQAKIPTPTAQVLRGFKADTRRALAEANKATRTRLKGKHRGAQATEAPSDAGAAMDELLMEVTTGGTPVEGSESGTLGGSSGARSAAGQPSGSDYAASGAAAPTASDVVMTSGATSSASGQPSTQEPRDQFPGGDGQEGDLSA